MNHRLFEGWLLTDELLETQQRKLLEEHLGECPSCQQLYHAWKEVEFELRESPQITPVVGFTQRWQERVAAEQIRRYRKQAFWSLAFYLAGAIGLLVLLILILLPVFLSPAPLLLAVAYQVSVWFSTISLVMEFINTFLRTLFGVVPITLWAGISLAVCSLIVLWFFAFRQLTAPRRVLV